MKLWLDYNLKYNCESYTVFQDSVSNSTRVTNSQVCLFSVPTINTTIAETATQLSSNENAASAYQWLECNNGYAPISNETSQIFTPAIDGSYAVQITVNGCRDTSACVDFTSSLSLIEQLNNHIQIHPNPANEAIVVGISSSMLFNVAITDIHGKILVNEENVGNGSKVDIQYLEAGSYFITFTIENERITKKLIKPILKGELKSGDTVKVTIKNNDINIEFVHLKKTVIDKIEPVKELVVDVDIK